MNTVRQGIVIFALLLSVKGVVLGYVRGRRQLPVSVVILLTSSSWKSSHARSGPQPRAPMARNGRRDPAAHRKYAPSASASAVCPLNATAETSSARAPELIGW